MRLFESLTLFAIFLALLLPQLLRAPRRRWLATLPIIAAMVASVQLLVEGYRWQMAPAYLLILILVGRSVWHLSRQSVAQHSGRIFLALTVIAWSLYVVALTLPILFPVPTLPQPAGSPVGTVTYHLIDDGRPEIYTVAPDDSREIVVQIWYPAVDDPETPRTPFIEGLDVAGPAIARRLDLPPFLLSHIDLVESNSYQNAPVRSGGPWPLLVFSHGLRGLRIQNTVLMETLASNGYVVASIDHTYGNILTLFPDDRVIFYSEARVFPEDEPFLAAGERLVDVWSADVLFVIDQILDWVAEPDHLLAGSVDGGRIGTLGHSTGGAAALEACAASPPCGAVLGLDPWIEPVSGEVAARYARPMMLLTAPEWLGDDNRTDGMVLYEGRTGDGYIMTIAGAEHFDFTDLPLLSPLTPLLGLAGPIASERMLAIMNAYSLAFFDETLKGIPSPLLQAPSPDYPEVRFVE